VTHYDLCILADANIRFCRFASARSPEPPARGVSELETPSGSALLKQDEAR
jgi:hypothetical protein